MLNIESKISSKQVREILGVVFERRINLVKMCVRAIGNKKSPTICSVAAS